MSTEKPANPPASNSNPPHIESEALTVKLFSDTSALPTKKIGPYELIRQIGVGGMGAVFEAQQTGSLTRRVALKVIKSQLQGQEITARFNSERQVLSLMEHPHIAQVFDAGATEEGLPFFVMELVDGQPVDLYCNRHCLTVRARVELFIKICSGVHHAHQKGVLHRDIKAANILVTTIENIATPKIIDFGIAKAIHTPEAYETPETRFGQMVGTPEYMSPEQAVTGGKDIDIRTDVYSLGVLLYYLISGRLPFPRKGSGPVSDYELLARIVADDPLPLSPTTQDFEPILQDVLKFRNTKKSTLLKELNGDLRWIILKCLEKERGNRYDSVSELASDLKKYLEHEPTIARPPDLQDRFKKFFLRHKVGVLSGFTVGLAMLAGVIGTTWGMLKARDAESQARNEAEKASLAQEQASLQRNLALNTLDMMVREVNDELSSRSDLNELRLSLLDLAVEGLNDVTGLSGTDLNAEKNLVIGNQTISRIYLTARREKEARNHIEKAIQTCEQLSIQHPDDPEIRILLAKTYNQAGALTHNFRLGNLTEAKDYFEQALKTLQDGSQTFQMSSDTRHLLAKTYSEIGDVNFDLGSITQAGDSYRQGLEIIQEVRQNHSSDLTLAYLEEEFLTRLGDVSFVDGNYLESEKFFLLALKELEAFPEEHQNTPQFKRSMALTQFSLGDASMALGDMEKSRAQYQSAAKIQRELLQIKPNHIQWKRDLVTSIFRLGDVAKKSENWGKAINQYRKAVTLTSELIQINSENSEAHRDLYICYIRIGDVFLQKKDYPQSEEAYWEALHQADWLRKHNKKSLGNNMDYAHCSYKLSLLYLEQGYKEKAYFNIKQGLSLIEELKEKKMLLPGSSYESWEKEFRNQLEKCKD